MNAHMAHHLAECSQAAFMEPGDAKRAYENLGYNEVDFIHNPETSTECFLVHGNTQSVLAFRGSEDVRDWITNFTFKLRPVKYFYGGMAHLGFMNSVASVFTELSMKIRHIQKPFYVTGHSLGGGLAVIASGAIRAQGLPINAVYVYGAPRAYGRTGAKKYDMYIPNTYRFEIAGDLIARMPKPIMGYRHVGKHMYFAYNGELLIDPSRKVIFKNNMQDLYDEVVEGDIFNWEDHKIAWYISKLDWIRKNTTI